MPQPYSYDLRQEVIQAIKLDGLKIIEASQLFNRASQHNHSMAEATRANRRLSSFTQSASG
jgi:transposase